MRQMITHIGHIELDYPLFWNTFNSSDHFIEESVETIDGGFVTYRLPKKEKKIALTNDGTQLQGIATKDALLDLSRIDGTTTITDYDGVVYDVEFDHTAGGVLCEPAYKAREAAYWNINIFLRSIDMARISMRTINSDTTVNTVDRIFVDVSSNPVTITLPSPSSYADIVVVQAQSSANLATITTPSGSIYAPSWSSQSLVSQQVSANMIHLFSDGSNYYTDTNHWAPAGGN